jgi:hypothetical protein
MHKIPRNGRFQDWSPFWYFVKAMKLKLSYKDLLLLLGIVVAAVITLTTWIYNDWHTSSSAIKSQPKEKTSLHASPSVAIGKLAKQSVLNSLKSF